MPAKTSRIVSPVGVLALALAAGAQAPPQQTPSKPPAEQVKAKEPGKKPKKVWTDDDLKDVRKPWDEYTEQKMAAEQAAAKAAEAKASEAKPGEGESDPAPVVDPKTGKPYEDPNSLEALERRLKKWEDELQRAEQQAEGARRKVSQTTDPDRWEIAKREVEIHEQNILDIKQEIKETRVQLAEAQKQRKAGTQSPPALPQAGTGGQPPAAPPQP